MPQFEAVFENGVFRPLSPVRLPEHQRVIVSFDELAESSEPVRFLLSEERWQAFCDALDAPPKEIPALRKLLSEPSLFDADRDALR